MPCLNVLTDGDIEDFVSGDADREQTDQVRAYLRADPFQAARVRAMIKAYRGGSDIDAACYPTR